MACKIIPPALLLQTIRVSGGADRWAHRKTIQCRIGGSVQAISKSADVLYAQGKIERRWEETQWAYRVK